MAKYLVKLAKANHCDTDRYCKEMLKHGQPGWQGVVRKWGQRFLDENENIDRILLRKMIFAHSYVRSDLEQILHPLVKNHVHSLKTAEKSTNLLVVEVPLLFEVCWQDEFDKVLTVCATKDQCLQRVMVRDNVTEQEALQAMEAQLPIEEKVKLSHYVVDNSGSLIEMQGQVNLIFQRIQKILSRA